MEDDLEAEIEALLESDDYEGELNNELLEPIWLQELKTALREDYIDSDTVKFILDRNILPDDDIKLRIQIWQVLLVVNGRSNHFSPVEQKIDFGTSTRKLGSKQLLGEQLIGHYLATRGVKFTPSLVDIVAPLVSLDHLADWEKYNLFYAIQAKFRPKSGATLSTLLELLIQYYDPLLYRFIKARQLNIITRSVDWIESLFRSTSLATEVVNSLWDVLFQSGTPVLPIWIVLVFIVNSRDELMAKPNDSSIPSFDTIDHGDLGDLLQLANYYHHSTPKCFIRCMIGLLFAKKPIQVDLSIMIELTPQELIGNILEGRNEVVLDVRPNAIFKEEHLIGSLRLSHEIEPGLVDPIKMNKSLAQFKSTIMRDLEKDEVEQLPFISFIGDTNEQSTLFTAATEAVKLGFIGVSIVQGGFDQVKKEIVQVGSEDLLLWREEEVVQQNTEQVNKEWNDPRGVTGWLVSTIANVTEKIDRVLTVENGPETAVDDQF